MSTVLSAVDGFMTSMVEAPFLVLLVLLVFVGLTVVAGVSVVSVLGVEKGEAGGKMLVLELSVEAAMGVVERPGEPRPGEERPPGAVSPGCGVSGALIEPGAVRPLVLPAVLPVVPVLLGAVAAPGGRITVPPRLLLGGETWPYAADGPRRLPPLVLEAKAGALAISLLAAAGAVVGGAARFRLPLEAVDESVEPADVLVTPVDTTARFLSCSVK